MGEIRKDNLHESLIEELNELANIDLSGKQDKTDESLLTESKDVIGAINELFQSANNGKQLIANAIGEPLDSNDTFSAMSNDINSLLSTFKTNMMNNGVMVESSDRFKSLIDKIATMVEEGSGKGIQFASVSVTGSINVAADVYSGTTRLNTPIGFTPTFVFIKATSTTGVNYTEGYKNYFISNLSPVTLTPEYNQGTITLTITGISSNSINLKYERNSASNSGHVIISDWYAIGVGEEDTTLRDSLASILQEEGVSVTEEDDMASLISKVDEEFTKDNNTISSMKQELADALVEKGVDVNTENTFDELVDSLINMNVGEVFPGISCRSSLPAEVEDGHIIIITENYNKIYVDNKKIDKMNLSEGDVYIKYGLESPYTENLNNLDSPISIHLEVVYQMINNEIVFVDEIYKGVDGEWVKILDSRVYYFNEGVFKVSSSAFSVNCMSQYNMGLITSGDFNNYFKLDVQFSNGNANGILAYGSDYKIDLTQFSKIKMTYTQKCTATTNYGYALVNDYTPGYFGLFTASEREVFYVGDSRMTCSKFVGHTRTNYDKEFTIEMDVTNIDGEHYFGVGIATRGITHINFSGMYIKSIEFIK